MALLTLAECASSPLTQKWLSLEAPLVVAMRSGPTPAIIHRAASIFMVARQFPRNYPNDRATDFRPVVAPLQRALAGLNEANLVERVEEFASEMAAIPNLARLGRRSLAGARPISAASKFVWCGVPTVGIIYDKWARRQLRDIGHHVPPRAYGPCVTAFRAELAKHTHDISMSLVHIHANYASQPWIKQKLFDLWLYQNGRAARPTP
jgi:hypothetical protein